MTHPYAAKAYAESLPHLGDPVKVEAWDAWMFSRAAPGGCGRDLTGPYPLTVLAETIDLKAGLDQLTGSGAVALVLVLSDALRPSIATLEASLDIFKPFKTHYLHDRSLGPVAYGKHHRYEVRRARAKVEVREVSLADHLPAWTELYNRLTAKHGLGGLHDFPPVHHRTLCRLEGVRTFAAFMGQAMVSAHIFVVHDGHAISHLAASSADGYAAGAAYAINDLALRTLNDCRIVNFGGAAGATDDPDDGLARFKRGFSNATAPSYLCGKVLDLEAYDALSARFARGGFFPAYRGRREEDVP